MKELTGPVADSQTECIESKTCLLRVVRSLASVDKAFNPTASVTLSNNSRRPFVKQRVVEPSTQRLHYNAVRFHQHVVFDAWVCLEHTHWGLPRPVDFSSGGDSRLCSRRHTKPALTLTGKRLALKDIFSHFQNLHRVDASSGFLQGFRLETARLLM